MLKILGLSLMEFYVTTFMASLVCVCVCVYVCVTVPYKGDILIRTYVCIHMCKYIHNVNIKEVDTVLYIEAV